MSRKNLATRRRLSLETLEDRLCLSSLPVGTSTSVPDAATQAHLSAAYGQLPLSFEANKGQTDARVNFLSRGAGYSLFLTPSKAVMSMKQGDTSNIVDMRIVGANPEARPVGRGKLPGVSNYMVGNNSSKWHTNVPNYAKAGYQGVYRGIDLLYHGNHEQLEYNFVVEPGADPRAIRLAFDGIQGKSLDANGNLILHTSGGDVVEHAPVAYQTIDGVQHAVASRFVLERDGQVGFAVGRYNHAKPLVIDPVLIYSTYLGGSSGDDGYGIAVDTAGAAYITGDTNSTNFPTLNPFQASKAGKSGYFDAFVTKFNAAGTALVYSTYLGGNGTDQGEGIAVDAAGEAYVVGLTASTNFPTKNAFQTTDGGNGGTLVDAFVTKLNSSGSGIVYSTYLGGTGGDRGHAIALDASGNAYVTGEATSANFPTVNALQPVKTGSTDAFVAKIDPSQRGANSLVYSTFLDGSAFSIGLGIAVDGQSNAYVTGRTGSSDFPTTPGAFQTGFTGADNDGFVTKLNAAGSALVYSTFLGGNGDDRPYGIALDGSGNAFVTGSTTSTNFPTANAFQSALRGGSDAFVSKLSADGSALVYSTYLGGSGSEDGTGNPRVGGIAVDAFDNAYVTGTTDSADFPTASAFQATNGGGQYDAFVTKLNPAGSGFAYSSYLGGNDWDQSFGIAVDSSGNAYLTGTTQSTNFPTKNALQPKKAGRDYDAFVTKITAS